MEAAELGVKRPLQRGDSVAMRSESIKTEPRRSRENDTSEPSMKTAAPVALISIADSPDAEDHSPAGEKASGKRNISVERDGPPMRRASDGCGSGRATSERRVGLDRRRGPGRRRAEIRRTAEEGEMAGDLLEFIMAIDEYKRINEKPFPAWSEIFEIIHYLGYRRVADRAEHINNPFGESEMDESPSDEETMDI